MHVELWLAVKMTSMILQLVSNLKVDISFNLYWCVWWFDLFHTFSELFQITPMKNSCWNDSNLPDICGTIIRFF